MTGAFFLLKERVPEADHRERRARRGAMHVAMAQMITDRKQLLYGDERHRNDKTSNQRYGRNWRFVHFESLYLFVLLLSIQRMPSRHRYFLYSGSCTVSVAEGKSRQFTIKLKHFVFMFSETKSIFVRISLSRFCRFLWLPLFQKLRS